MYQSIPSLTMPPRQTTGNFLKGRIPHPRAQRQCETLTPGAEKMCLNLIPGAIIFKTPAKYTKHEIEIMKSSTEILICLEILKQWNI